MRIPRIIHRIWLGSAEMPESCVRFGETWREHHPGWEVRTWTDSNLPPLTDPAAFARCRNHAEASDVIRYDLLHRYGGIYVDTDVECLRSLEPLIEDASAFAAWQRPNVIGSAVVGSIPAHPAIGEVLRTVCEGAGSGDQVQATGPGALTRVLKDAPDVILFGPETFFPYDYWETPVDSPADGTENAYAIHHWHATWQSSESLTRTKRKQKARIERLQKANRELRRELKRKDREIGAVRRRKRALRRELNGIRETSWWRLRRWARRVQRRLRVRR